MALTTVSGSRYPPSPSGEWAEPGTPYHGRVPFGTTRRTITPLCVKNTSNRYRAVTVAKYSSRHWAVWLGEELIAVTVYQKGARRVA